MNYSQGTWENKGLEVIIYGKGIIAKCLTPQNGGVFECSANAHLITAAPLMHKALIAIGDLLFGLPENELRLKALAEAEGIN